jgi:hypothetical protein
MGQHRNMPPDECYFAFVDIMGFREQVKQAAIAGTVRETAERISATVRRAKQEYDDMMRMLEEKWEEYEERPLQVFSDTVWYAERVRDGESNVFSFVNRLLILNAELASDALFVRGALVQGRHFDDRTLVFSPALIAAYDHERTDAVHPRIVVAENVGQAYRRAVRRYPRIGRDGREALWRDDDGWLFVNYLDVLSINRGWDEEQCRHFLMTHKRNIQDQLSACSSKPYIRAKYLWLAKYHNRYCRRRYKNRCPANLTVPGAPTMGPSAK